jgi:hypothetical protein
MRLERLKVLPVALEFRRDDFHFLSKSSRTGIFALLQLCDHRLKSVSAALLLDGPRVGVHLLAGGGAIQQDKGKAENQYAESQFFNHPLSFLLADIYFTVFRMHFGLLLILPVNAFFIRREYCPDYSTQIVTPPDHARQGVGISRFLALEKWHGK